MLKGTVCVSSKIVSVKSSGGSKWHEQDCNMTLRESGVE